ncbi:baseplate J/gp47 family protein [Acinetobacter nectaris]|uniref:baseplate J/gp47 family protein n=1 Tax=Acinetobacter nectaris TaxID=1219382 RepID=UPI001F1B95EF|nr:baseplate J/gp47 family protein [Acinetobacter nectaris]MCF8999302.1 baseplate J/gp47 family protein [Acinetobacter nectaris]MCF9028091.1 baseplate J/gp47 family protein [Acinetobacter nectaris]
MAYSIKSFEQIRKSILQEYRNTTGITASDDSDAGIRADGTASVVEGLYHHQTYIQRQLFISTADEPYLYIHAEELNLPRLGGSTTTGSVTAQSNVDLTIKAGTKLTDGNGYYWHVTSDTYLISGQKTTVNITADQVGASWNFTGTSLLWVSPLAGLDGTATVNNLTGGADSEALEDWRTRLLERKQLGFNRDRKADIVSVMHTISGVEYIYVYPKRRGLGSLDVAITASGKAIPSKSLLDTAQVVLDDYAGFWADCRAFAPTERKVDLVATITGISANLTDVEETIKSYFNELEPAQTLQVSTLISRIMALDNVSDVVLSQNSNIVAEVNWMHVEWLRAGNIVVKQT